MVSQPAADRLPPAWLAAAMERLPDGLAVFDADWAIRYANPAAARLLGRPAEELTGRNLWIVLPELAGSVFHGFLLHARTVGTRVTWRGFYPPAGRWLSATTELVDDLLLISLRTAADQRLEGPADADARDGEAVATADEDADRERLRFLAEVAEAMSNNLDVSQSASQLTAAVLPRLGDWAIVALLGDDGGPGEEAWAHRDPARRADLDTYMRGRLRGAADDALVEALLSGEPVQVSTIDQQQVAPSLPTEEVREAWRRLNATSCTIVPLRARGETFGALALLNAGNRPLHTELEIATAVEVARRGALALDNARL